MGQSAGRFKRLIAPPAAWQPCPPKPTPCAIPPPWP